MIGVIGERTKKKKEVSRRIWALLKSDEEALVEREKELKEVTEMKKLEEKERRKGEKSHCPSSLLRHHDPSSQSVV